MHYSKLPKVPGGYDNWLHGNGFSQVTDFIVADWAGQADPKTLAEGRPGTLTCYCPIAETGGRFLLYFYDFDFWEQRILADMEKALPDVHANLTGIDLYRWGHAMIQARPGFAFGDAREKAQEPLGRIAFAASDIDGIPAFENAYGVALRAAEYVKTRIG